VTRRLSLKSEHLAALTSSELEAVGGAQYAPSQGCTGYYTTIDAPCATHRTADITTIIR
jgi:hypothetical protein